MSVVIKQTTSEENKSQKSAQKAVNK